MPTPARGAALAGACTPLRLCGCVTAPLPPPPPLAVACRMYDFKVKRVGLQP